MKIIIIDNIRIPVEQAYNDGLVESVASEIKKKLGSFEFEFSGILRKSIDARRKGRINYTVSALISVSDSFSEERVKNCRIYKGSSDEAIEPGNESISNPPIIAGSGPCGLFCAYMLAKNGYQPIVLERGDDIDTRQKAVKDFWKTGRLDTESNVQFGEGGAGTFSDGKLVTRINDPRCKKVMDIFIKNGAPSEIAYEAKPHIGTDALISVIKGIRSEIESMGGRFLFRSQLTSIDAGESIKSININKEYDIPADVLVLAIGHSARNTYEMLLDNGLELEQKPFSAGVRIEHRQQDVNEAQWGRQSQYIDTAADYSLHGRWDGRAAYTFCMCPGGVVVNASSEKNRLTVNGMSYKARKGRNANSAWVAEVMPSDLGSDHPLAGIEFQRELEERTFLAGGGGFAAPVQLFGDFLEDRESTGFKSVVSSFTGDTGFYNLNSVLPDFIKHTLKASVEGFGRKLSCFTDSDAVLTGCETRTSSPVRIKRKPDLESTSIKGIYPAGEGAGYAGGIMSAAVDGLRVAESIIKLYNYTG